MPSAIAIAIADARRQIIAREAPYQAAMASLYERTIRALETDLLLLQLRIEQAYANGEDVNRDWLRRQQRYTQLLIDAEREFARFTDDGTRVVNGAQVSAVRGGAVAAWELADAAGVQAPTGGRVNTRAVESAMATLTTGPVTRSLARYGDEYAHVVSDTLLDGIGRGRSPRAVIRDISRQMRAPVHPARLESLIRTESMRAYRSSLNEQYAAMGNAISGYRWSAAKSVRTCLACLAQDGKVRPEPWDTMHISCFPAGTVVNGPLARAATKRWYEGKLVEIVTASDQRLAVTPNHPILTSHGWVAAGLLRKCDDVIRYLKPQGPTAAINPDHQDRPAFIEDVAESLANLVGSVTSEMPTTAVDFHGDGTDGKVNIVWTDSLLRGASDAVVVRYPHLQESFIARCVSLALLAGLRSALQFIERTLATTDSIMGWSSPDVALLGSSAGHTCIEGRGPIPARNASIPQPLVNDRTGDAKALGQRLLGLTGEIVSDQIVHINRRDYSGHVYNLETSEGWYISNTIICHNCRCINTPVPRGSTYQYQTGEDWLRTQAPETQRKMFPTQDAWRSWQDGAVGLSDFVGHHQSKTWGRSIYQRSGRDALGRAEQQAITPQAPPASTTRPTVRTQTTPDFQNNQEAAAWARKNLKSSIDYNTLEKANAPVVRQTLDAIADFERITGRRVPAHIEFTGKKVGPRAAAHYDHNTRTLRMKPKADDALGPIVDTNEDYIKRFGAPFSIYDDTYTLMWHEMGHAVDFATGSSWTQRARQEIALGKWDVSRLSGYGDTKVEEAIAESFVAVAIGSPQTTHIPDWLLDAINGVLGRK